MQLSARIVPLELAETFVISRGATDMEQVAQVELRHGEVSGFGEAAPVDYHGETAESALAYLEEHADLLGDDPFALDEIESRLPPREWAARAALDAALHDLQGKLLGLPLWRLLGLRRVGPPTSWTIWLGDPDDMARRAANTTGFARLKLKLGGGDRLDVERVRAVRDVTDVPLQVDVNEGWSFDEARDALPQLGELGVQYCEQPLREGDPDGPRLKPLSPIPVYVDEDCHHLADVARCADRAHGINIKLAKSGGRQQRRPVDCHELTRDRPDLAVPHEKEARRLLRRGRGHALGQRLRDRDRRRPAAAAGDKGGEKKRKEEPAHGDSMRVRVDRTAFRNR